jgi:hypothetical protein
MDLSIHSYISVFKEKLMKFFKKTSVIIMSIFFGLIAVFAMMKEKDTYSDSERRVLAKFPEPTFENILDGDFSADFDAYATDTFPYRDLFRSIKANTVLNIFQQKDNNQLYQAGNHLAKMEYEIQPSMIEHATKLFHKIKDQYLTNQKVYFSLIPDKHHYLAESYHYLQYDLNDMKLMRPWRTFGCIAVDMLGLPENEYPFYDPKYRKKAQKVLKIILAEGNFGKEYLKTFNRPSGYLRGKLYSFSMHSKRNMRLLKIFPKEACFQHFWLLKGGLVRLFKG